MTPEEFKKEMEEIEQVGDGEIRHDFADTLLCEVLEELGYSEGVKIFKSMEKWYA